VKATRKRIVRLAIVLTISSFAQIVTAQTSEAAKLYLGIGVGPIVPQAVTSNLAGAITGSGKVEFNASGFVGLVGGYRATAHFAIDAEAGWTLYDSHDLTGTFSGALGPQPSDIPLNGDMHTWVGLANFEYRPRRATARLAPYFGPSIGAAGLEWLVDSRPGGSVILSLRGGSASFAAGALAGIDYALSKHFSLGGRYDFVHVTSSGPTISGGGITLVHSTPEIHLLQMVGTYRF
jgi:hypothetical protein